MDEIKKLSELDENQINQAMNVFIEGFYNIMSAITKDKEKLQRLQGFGGRIIMKWEAEK